MIALCNVWRAVGGRVGEERGKKGVPFFECHAAVHEYGQGGDVYFCDRIAARAKPGEQCLNHPGNDELISRTRGGRRAQQRLHEQPQSLLSVAQTEMGDGSLACVRECVDLSVHS